MMQQYLWLVPIFFTFHNLEEALFFQKWSGESLIPGPAVKALQFRVAVILLTFIAFIATWLTTKGQENNATSIIVIAMQAVIFFNSLIPHVFYALKLFKYNPGLGTAFFINIPFSLFLFWKALSEKVLSVRMMLVLLAIAPLVMILLVRISLKLAEILLRLRDFLNSPSDN